MGNKFKSEATIDNKIIGQARGAEKPIEGVVAVEEKKETNLATLMKLSNLDRQLHDQFIAMKVTLDTANRHIRLPTSINFKTAFTTMKVMGNTDVELEVNKRPAIQDALPKYFKYLVADFIATLEEFQKTATELNTEVKKQVIATATIPAILDKLKPTKEGLISKQSLDEIGTILDEYKVSIDNIKSNQTEVVEIQE